MTPSPSRRFAAPLSASAVVLAALAAVAPAHATVAPSAPWHLDFIATTLVPSTDGTALYAAALDSSGDVQFATIDTSTGAVTERTVTPTMATLSDSTAADTLDSVALDPSGKVEIGAEWPGATDPTTSIQGSERYGVESFDASTLVPSGVVVTTSIPVYLLALDESGNPVVSDGSSIEVGSGDPITLPTSAGTTAAVQQLSVRGGVVAVIGGDYDNSTDASTPDIWTMPLGGTTPAQVAVPDAFQPWDLAMATDGTAYVGELKDNGPDADSSYQVQVVGGAADGSVIPVDDITHLSLTQDGLSLYAGDQTVSLNDPTHPTSVNWPQYGQLIAVGDGVVYTTPQNNGTDTTESIVALTPPAAATDVSVASSGDGSATVQFTAPAESFDDPAYVTYTVTAQPLVNGEPSGPAVSPGDVSDDASTSWSAQFTGASALTPGTTYSFSVRADNGAFAAASTPVTHRVQPFVPGTGSVAITGTPTVGSTVSATVSGFQGDGITYTYEWDTIVSGGQSADVAPIAGATSSTLTLTDALLGKQVGVTVTAHRDGYEPTTAWSQPVTVSATPSPTAPGNGPSTVGSITAHPVKAGSKKVTLSLSGVGTLSGKVKVYDGKKLLGTATVINGKLVLKLHKSLGHGKHHLKLSYAGSAATSAFTKTVTLKVH